MLGGLFTATCSVSLAVVAGCQRDDSCLAGTCPTPCRDVAYSCEPRDLKPLFIGRAAEAPQAYRLARAGAADDDIVMSNGVVTAVVGQLAHDLDLAPTGGNLIALGPAGGDDDVTVIYQLAGILPDDAFAYRELAVEQLPDRVAVTVRGTLDLRPSVAVATRYEIGACDPGVRIRSELLNGSAETHTWFVADTWHNGTRMLPFVPVRDFGYQAPELELLELTELWDPFEFDGAAEPSPDSPGYATMSCSDPQLLGVHDPQITAAGTTMRIVRPGDSLIFERMIMAAGRGRGPAPALDEAVAARAQLFDRSVVSVRGRIVAGAPAHGFGGDARRASLIIYAGDRPVSAVIPDSDGNFTAAVASGDAADLAVEVWSFGRIVTRVAAPGGRAGDIAIGEPATIELTATRDGVPGYATASFDPADQTTRAAVAGSFHGRQRTCAPWLGPSEGPSPACNHVTIRPTGTTLEVPAGHYVIYAIAGPEHTMVARELTVSDGDHVGVSFPLVSLPIVPPGWFAADLHVHGRASFDSAMPDRDRVESFAAANVAIIAATDHDVIGDYRDVVFDLDLEDQIAVMGGIEATQVIPWLEVPGEDVPRVIGHFNFWPLRREPSAPRGGAPSDERIEPGELFDRMAPLIGDGGMMMLNHPWDEPLFGRDLGYLRAIKYDPRVPIRDGDPLLHRPAGDHRNIDWNVMEVINGADPSELMKARVLWYALLAQGYVTAGAGNSDSHGMSDNQLGWARNWVDVGTRRPPVNSVARINEALRAGRFAAGNGVFVHVELVDANGVRTATSLAPHVAHRGDQLAITVRAAPWIPVDEIRVVTSRGTRVLASGLAAPADPFGTAGVVRFAQRVALADLVDRDDFIVVEAGLAYPLAADLDDDGVADTTDNNHDGVVDRDDVDPDEDVGPIAGPPDPQDPRDPRFLITRVIPKAYPEGFANPVVVDLDGNGWVPPGIP